MGIYFIGSKIECINHIKSMQQEIPNVFVIIIDM